MGDSDDWVLLFTDGACSGNPGPGGWGALLRYREHEKELSGSEAATTNNRMELLAAINGLEAVSYTHLSGDRTPLRTCSPRPSCRWNPGAGVIRRSAV